MKWQDITQAHTSRRRRIVGGARKSFYRVGVWAKRHTTIDYIWIVAVSFCVCLPLFSGQMIYGHDGEFHLYRFKGFWDGLLGGQIVPQIDPNAVDGYGHGVGIFYGPVVSGVVSLLHLVFPSWTTAANVFCIGAVVVSGFSMYWFVRDMIGKRGVALVAALLYLAMPYRLETIYVRQAYGEIAAYALAPLVFWGIHRILYRKKYGVLLLGLSASAIFLSHNISVVVIGLFSLFYIVGNYKMVRWQTIRRLLYSGLIAGGLSAFFWLPLIVNLSSDIYNISSLDFIMHRSTADLQGSALDLQYLFLDIGYKAGLNFFIGAVSIVGLALLMFLWAHGDLKQLHIAKQSFVLALIALLIVSPLIQWQFMPSFMHAIQFPWRFLAMFDLFLSIAIACAIFYCWKRYIKKRVTHRTIVIATVVLSCLVVLSSINVMARVYYKAPIAFDYSITPRHIHGVAMGEYLPREALKDDYIYTRSPIEVLSGDAHVSNVTYNGLTVTFWVESTTRSRIELPRIYYYGYDSSSSIVESSPHGLAMITIQPTNGKEVTVQFGLSVATILGIGISATTFACLLVVLGKKRTNAM